MSNILKRIPPRDSFFSPIEEAFDNFFTSFFQDKAMINSVKSNQGYPKIDVYSENGNWIVKAAVPGVKPEKLNVSISDGVLTISGQMEEEYKTSDSAEVYVHELKKSRFIRSISIPQNKSISDTPKAIMQDGILTLTFESLKDLPPPPDVKQIPIISK